jgi:CRISPR-associated endoribonuclease Cas6
MATQIITTPAKLYALLLQLRPLERGTLMPFTGELVHGAWLNWVRNAAPDVATMLHSGNKRRLFTCSSLQFPFLPESLLQAQRENKHLPLDPAKRYSLRLTLLLGDLYPLFYHTLMSRTEKQPFLHIGKQAFLLDSVISAPNDASRWAGFTTFADLVERAKEIRFGRAEPLALEFASLTTFNWIYVPDKTYGNHFARVPLPRYVFPGLARRWQELAPPELVHVVQKERIEAYIEADGAVIDDYELQTHMVHFSEYPQRGFIGSCCYLLRGPDERTTPDAPLTVRQQLWLLAKLAFYTGVGYKPTMGMGQTRLL